MKIGKGSIVQTGITAISQLANGGQQKGGQQRHGQGRTIEDIRLQKMRHDRLVDKFEGPASAVDMLKGASAKVLQETKSKNPPKGALATMFKAFGKLF